MDMKCLKEKLPDLAYALAFIGIGLFFTVIGSAVLPIIGFLVAAVTLWMVAPELKEIYLSECRLGHL